MLRLFCVFLKIYFEKCHDIINKSDGKTLALSLDELFLGGHKSDKNSEFIFQNLGST